MEFLYKDTPDNLVQIRAPLNQDTIYDSSKILWKNVKINFLWYTDINFVAEYTLHHICKSLYLSHTSQVASIFTLPVSKLAEPSAHRYTRFRLMTALRFPVFLGGPRRVWGVTAFILDMALTHILPQQFNYVPIAARRNYASK